MLSITVSARYVVITLVMMVFSGRFWVFLFHGAIPALFGILVYRILTIHSKKLVKKISDLNNYFLERICFNDSKRRQKKPLKQITHPKQTKPLLSESDANLHLEALHQRFFVESNDKAASNFILIC